jgi:ATPase subunit of ABC transporter with duplicated ATPase domains
MRVSLARALFAAPALLLLDEPTNHLDLEACVWLEHYLQRYPKCLVIISHSQDFLNGVCTNIIEFAHQRITYYSGNYDTYRATRAVRVAIRPFSTAPFPLPASKTKADWPQGRHFPGERGDSGAQI